MERNKIIFIIVLIALGIIGVILYINLLPPDYNQILLIVEELMKNTNNVSLNYAVSFDGVAGGLGINASGNANYELINKTSTWNNTLNFVKNTFYDMSPENLINIMKLSNVSEIIDYQSTIPCYALNSMITEGITSKLLLKTYDYVRIIACFDKTTGYPLQYTLLAVNTGNAILVTYNSLINIVKEPKPYNESEIAQLEPPITPNITQ